MDKTANWDLWTSRRENDCSALQGHDAANFLALDELRVQSEFQFFSLFACPA
jgi:hypothetical protein